MKTIMLLSAILLSGCVNLQLTDRQKTAIKVGGVILAAGAIAAYRANHRDNPAHVPSPGLNCQARPELCL